MAVNYDGLLDFCSEIINFKFVFGTFYIVIATMKMGSFLYLSVQR